MENRQTHAQTEISGFGYVGFTDGETVAIWKLSFNTTDTGRKTTNPTNKNKEGSLVLRWGTLCADLEFAGHKSGRKLWVPGVSL